MTSKPTSNRGTEFLRYAQAFRPPITLILDPFVRDPREVLEELREADPDGHANLTEHIVLPERKP